MKRLLHAVLARRARALAEIVRPHLPAAGRALDVGCGTGHNARALMDLTDLRVTGVDVVDLRAVGAPPVRFEGATLPFADGAFACALVLFVLQYVAAPERLLAETRRVTSGPVLVIQSTYRGPMGWGALRANEVLWGPLAYAVGRASGLVDGAFSLGARRLYTRPRLQDLFARAGLGVRVHRPAPWPLMPVSYDLFVLEGLR